MTVLDPIKITISNFEKLEYPANHFINVSLFPSEIAASQTTEVHSIAVDNVVYIEKTDFQEVL